MEIIHRVDFELKDHAEDELDILEVKYERLPFAGRVIIRVELPESSPRWPEFQALFQTKGKKDWAFETYFTTEEILSAEWLRLLNNSLEIGYPQPEKEWLKNRPNYDEWCKQCGAFHQASSFFVKTEPKIRKYDFANLNWTSAIFAVPKVFAVLKANNITGYECWPVFIHKNKEPSLIISQLYIDAATGPTVIEAEDLEPFICDTCGALKYKRFHKHGIMYMRRETIPTGVDIFETYEWFGGGLQPRREVIVSNRVAQLAYAENWKGINFKVVKAI
jgi:hypothetical protein